MWPRLEFRGPFQAQYSRTLVLMMRKLDVSVPKLQTV